MKMLAAWKFEDANLRLNPLLKSADDELRYAAIHALGLIGSQDTRALLEKMIPTGSACLVGSVDKNPGWSLAAEILEGYAQGKDKIILRLPPGFESLSLWLEQLVAESLGKEGLGVVPISDAGPREAEGDDRKIIRG